MIARRTLLAILFLVPVSAHAQIAVTDGGSLLQQIKAFKQMTDSYITQLAQLKAELSMYANLVTNTLALPQAVWAQVQGDIMQVRNLANAASLLTGNSGSILARLNSANGYLQQASLLPTNIGQQFAMWQTTQANATLQLGRTLGVQQGQEQNYTALQAAIQAHSQTAAGQMQAIQAGNELAGLTNTQLQQIQTTLTAMAQQTAARDTVADERQALGDAYATQFFSQPAPPLTGWPRYQ